MSLFFAEDQWIAWTPQGYYATSPDGEKLMGWHVNHGADRMGEFLPAAQFRRRLYRPDVVRFLLETGSLAKALEVADAEQGRSTGATEVARILPPEVEVATPRHGSQVTDPRLEVKAIARSRGANPVTALRLLLDGRPYRGQAGVATVASPRPGEVRQVWNVELEPGDHQIAVQADSAVSQTVSAPVEVTCTGARQADAGVLPDLYVLTIGISAYPGSLRLNYAAADAEAITRAFRDKSAALFHKVEGWRVHTSSGRKGSPRTPGRFPRSRP
jgi:hypothetical protein